MIAIIDVFGVYGALLHYAIVISFVGSAFIAFIYLWRKGQLNMDEGPKFQMMQQDDIAQQEEKNHDFRK